jgi:hypothetical protein
MMDGVIFEYPEEFTKMKEWLEKEIIDRIATLNNVYSENRVMTAWEIKRAIYSDQYLKKLQDTLTDLHIKSVPTRILVKRAE